MSTSSPCHTPGAFDVPLLAVLVAPTEQDDRANVTQKVKAIPWPVVDTRLGDAAAYCPNVAEVAERYVPQAGIDAGHCGAVAQVANPPPEGADFDHLDHVLSANHSWHPVKLLLSGKQWGAQQAQRSIFPYQRGNYRRLWTMR